MVTLVQKLRPFEVARFLVKPILGNLNAQLCGIQEFGLILAKVLYGMFYADNINWVLQ